MTDVTGVVEATEAPSSEIVLEMGGPPGEVVSEVPTLAPKPKGGDDSDVLDLTNLIPTRKLVKLATPDHPEGTTFELRLLDDFGIVEQQQLLTWSKRFEKLWNHEGDEDLTDAQRTTMMHLLDQMFGLVLAKPSSMSDDEFNRAKEAFPDYVKSRVVTAFTYVPLMMRQEAEARAEEKKTQSTSES